MGQCTTTNLQHPRDTIFLQPVLCRLGAVGAHLQSYQANAHSSHGLNEKFRTKNRLKMAVRLWRSRPLYHVSGWERTPPITPPHTYVPAGGICGTLPCSTHTGLAEVTQFRVPDGRRVSRFLARLSTDTSSISMTRSPLERQERDHYP